MDGIYTHSLGNICEHNSVYNVNYAMRYDSGIVLRDSVLVFENGGLPLMN